MTEGPILKNRRIAVIMFTDMVGYSSVTYEDESRARQMVDHQRSIVRNLIVKFGGTERQTTGDGFLIEFASAVEAVDCAIAIQTQIYEYNLKLPEERRVYLRLGLHVGDIINAGEDLHGNGVNVAARIEPLAWIGGICLSQQVVDLIEQQRRELKFQKIGKKKLKNIPNCPNLYQLILPWMSKKESVVINWLSNWDLNFTMKFGLFFGAFIVTLLVLFEGGVANKNQFPFHAHPNEEGTQNYPDVIKLDRGWEYAVLTESSFKSPDTLLSQLDHIIWKEYSPLQNWKYSDSIKGLYLLRNRFQIKYEQLPTDPILILGIVTEQYRIFINGNFIGGSDHLSDLNFYPLARSLLLQNDMNEIIILASTRPSLNPGLNFLSSVAPGIYTYSKGRELVTSNQVQFHLLRSIYLSICLLLLVGAFILFVLQKSSLYFYYCFVLFLGVVHLLYYNPWVTSELTYESLRFLKIFSLGLVPFILMASLYSNINLKFKERITLIFGCVFIAVACFMILIKDHSPFEFIKLYNIFLGLIFIFNIFYLTMAFKALIKEIQEFKGIQKSSQHKLKPLWLCFNFAYGFTNLMAILGSFKAEALFFQITGSLRVFFVDVSLTMPFLLSIFISIYFSLDYHTKKVFTQKRYKRDELIRRLMHLMSTSQQNKELILKCQAEICDYVKATRSTIYLYKDNLLIGEFVYPEMTENSKQPKIVLDSIEGVIKYVFDHRVPLNLANIKEDVRFYGKEAMFPMKENKSFSSPSCMIFPLISRSSIQGVFTLADKNDKGTFSEEEFQLTTALAPVLSLLVDNVRIYSIN